MLTEDQRREFFLIMDRGSTIRAAAIEVGVSPDVGYRWMRKAGLSALRNPPRVYTAEEKAEFFRRLAERGNVSAVARELGFVRVTCYKWAHQAGIFTGYTVDAKRAQFQQLRSEGLSRATAAERAGIDKRTAQDWDRGIRQFYGGRIYPDGSIVKYSSAERIANVKRPRATYLTAGDLDFDRLERRIHNRFLSLEDRERIHDLRAGGASIRATAKAMGRAPSTVSRELARNSTKEIGYLPYGAQRLAAARRARTRPCKLAVAGPLRDRVLEGLQQRWSPEQVSKRLAKDLPGDLSMRACPETIYQAIYRDGPDALRRDGTAPTRSRRTRRQPRRDPEHRRPRFIEPMRLIAQRPAEVELRSTVGHWEGDLIVGTLHRSAIATIVDRSTRYLILVHLDGDHTADRVRDRLIDTMGALPEPLRRTLTWDQGAEMSGHGEIRAATGIDVYFCDPASPWQRGTNENTNGLLRDYFPKGTDLSQHSPHRLAEVAHELNTRPRKILDWDTPEERLTAQLSSA